VTVSYPTGIPPDELELAWMIGVFRALTKPQEASRLSAPCETRSPLASFTRSSGTAGRERMILWYVPSVLKNEPEQVLS
jgi:hypothetical protein